ARGAGHGWCGSPASRTVMLHHPCRSHFVTHLRGPRRANVLGARRESGHALASGTLARSVHGVRSEEDEPPWKTSLVSTRPCDTEVYAPDVPSGRDGASCRSCSRPWCWGSGSRGPRTIRSVTVARPTPSR